MDEVFSFPVTVKHLRSSKRMRLRVMPNGEVVVTCHPRTPQRLIYAFVREHQVWVEQKRNTALKRLTSLTQTREKLLFRGKIYEFKLQITSKELPRVELQSDSILVVAHSENHQAIRLLLEQWYRQHAAQYFQQRVPLLADVVDRGVVRVSVRDQRTRWGSCSSRRNISLNWRLILTPDWVSDYVIYHELAHLSEMNHSDRFWQLVEQYCPRYKEAEKWLKDHHELLRF